MTKKQLWTLWAAWVLILAYIAVAYSVFAFRHPGMTDTQRLLHTWDAFRFRTIPQEQKND